MDLATLALSAGISAVVGTLFSVLTVSRLTVGRMRAERAEAARHAVREAAKQTMRDVDLYRRNLRSTLHRENADTAYPADAVVAAAVLTAAEGLRSYRRWLVRRRCIRVFGREFVNLSALYSGEQALAMGALFAPLLTHGVRRAAEGERFTFTDGFLHRGLVASPGSAATNRLWRELRKLASSW